MTTTCPRCNKQHKYDPEQACYPGLGYYQLELEEREVTLSLCDCGAVLAVLVADPLGEQLYEPKPQPTE